MKNIITLDKLPTNVVGTIADINCDTSVNKRLNDLGLITGTTIISVFQSPFKNPTAYEFKNTIIALRNNDAMDIKVKI